MEIVKDTLFELAESYVERTSLSVFLTGKAGTGKTTFLKYIVEKCPKRSVVLAPTGVAAINAGGVTIHSFFSLPLCPYLPDVKELVTEYQMPQRFSSLRKSKLEIIRTLELLIIDEISMVRADLMDAVDMVLRKVRRIEKPFGGVQLLMIGDAGQLSPVVKDGEKEYLAKVYEAPYFFFSKALSSTPYVSIELQTVYRQSESRFIDILNAVRDNRLTGSLMAELNSRITPENRMPQDCIRLTTHNRQADSVNDSRMESLVGEKVTYEASIEGVFPESSYPAETSLTLRKGARVMFTRNDAEGAYFNGKIGTVTSLGKTSLRVRDEEGREIDVKPVVWENITYDIDKETGDILQNVEGQFSQIPLRPAWAITIHKSQGLTFDKVIIEPGRAFAPGQIYVALSRCRTLEGIFLSSAVSPYLLHQDPVIARFNASFPSVESLEANLPGWERAYEENLLCELFGLESLRRQTFTLRKIWLSDLASTYPMQLQTIEQAADAISEMEDVASRFRKQIHQLAADPAFLAERTHKAAGYFLPRLNDAAETLPPVFAVEIDNKDVRKIVKSLEESMLPSMRFRIILLERVLSAGFSREAFIAAKVKAELSGKPQPGKRKSSRKTDATDAAKVYTGNAHPELVARLVEWRRKKAEAEDVPAYCILHQKALLAIADEVPATPKELLALPGIGKTVLEKYGEEILALLQ